MSTFQTRFKLLALNAKGVLKKRWRWFSDKVKTGATKTKAIAQKSKVKTIQFVKTKLIPMIKKNAVRLVLALGFLIASAVAFTRARGNKIPTEATSEGIWFVAICLVGLSVLILRSFKKKKGNTGHDSHGDGHGHASGGHDDHHGNQGAAFIKEVLKTWYIAIPLVIIFAYWIFSPVTWGKFKGTYAEPLPDYAQGSATARFGNDSVWFLKPIQFGPEEYRFEQEFDHASGLQFNLLEKSGGWHDRTGKGPVRVISVTRKNPRESIFHGIYWNEKLGQPPPESEWTSFSLELKARP